MKHWKFLSGLIMTAVLLFTTSMLTPVCAQDQKSALFQPATEAMQQAKDAGGEQFSPENFRKGMKQLSEANEDFKRGKNREDIEKKLQAAQTCFLQAVENVKLAEIHFKDMISAREDALSAEAPNFRAELWKEAEDGLYDAAKALESGNLNSAKEKGRKAERLYREAELESIKANYLDVANELLEEAKNKNIKKRAPITLKSAQDLALKSEQVLVENRYDTDEARQLAQEAKAQALHALFLSQYIEEGEKRNRTTEELILSSESFIQQIADVLDVKAQFDNGLGKPTEEIISKIRGLQQKIASLGLDLNDKDAQISAMQQQINEMQSQLGDLKIKEANLSQLMDQQRILREKFQKVEQSFTPEEAQVLRIGDQVVIRLYGLSFQSGKSIIESQYFGLLAKVVDAFKLYPSAGISVEGHTDSRGSDDANQKLSTERAEAVREYLLSASGIESSRILAVGYGESKPIATNETNEGRRKNRRIDIVIHPKK